MLILTAFNSAYTEMGSLCVQSIARYCKLHPKARFVSQLIPDDYARPASWFKVGAIRRHLPDHDFVLWIDCDALIIGKQDITQILSPVTLNISKDKNGMNHGVATWRNCPESLAALDRMESLSAEFLNHPWWEQAALMTFIDEISVCYQPKEVFNAYPEDACEATQILHFPGMTNEERIPLMKERLPA